MSSFPSRKKERDVRNIHWNAMTVMFPLWKLSSGSFLLTKRKEIQNLFAPFAFTFLFLLCMEMQCLFLFHLDDV